MQPNIPATGYQASYWGVSSASRSKNIIPLVLHVLCLVLHVLCLVLHVLYPPVFYPYFFYPQLFFAHPFFLPHFILNFGFLPVLLKSLSSGKFYDLSESRKPKAESQKPRAESREPRAESRFNMRFVWFSWDLVVLPMCCRCIPALRGPRREPPCIDGWDGWMDGLVRTCFCFAYFSETKNFEQNGGISRKCCLKFQY